MIITNDDHFLLSKNDQPYPTDRIDFVNNDVIIAPKFKCVRNGAASCPLKDDPLVPREGGEGAV